MWHGTAQLAAVLGSPVESPPGGCGPTSVSRFRMQLQVAHIRSRVAPHAGSQKVATQGAPVTGCRSAEKKAQGTVRRDGRATCCSATIVKEKQILCREDLRDLQSQVCQR